MTYASLNASTPISAQVEKIVLPDSVGNCNPPPLLVVSIKSGAIYLLDRKQGK